MFEKIMFKVANKYLRPSLHYMCSILTYCILNNFELTKLGLFDSSTDLSLAQKPL